MVGDTCVCSAGFRYEPSTSSCSRCPPGSHKSDASNLKNCVQCPPGTHQPAVGSAECVPCSSGDHQPYRGQRECIPCASPLSSFDGAPECNVCTA
eukprot:4378508-Prymnesium_polylepis.1